MNGISFSVKSLFVYSNIMLYSGQKSGVTLIVDKSNASYVSDMIIRGTPYTYDHIWP